MLDDFGLFYAQYPVIFGLVTFVFGTLVGSFLNVVILRLPLILERTWQEEAALILGEAPKAGRQSHYGAQDPLAPLAPRPFEPMTTSLL